MSYDDAFYDTIREGCRSSAAAVAPLVADLLAPATVVDVGCGQGIWAAEFATLGAEVLGVDGPYVADPLVPFVAHDLASPLRLDRTFDLAVSLEVAEHLPPERAAGFVEDLAALSDAVLFSAAVPGQGGVGHLNEQPPRFWADLLATQGYRVTGALRWLIWEDERVENWYRANLLLAMRNVPAELEQLFTGPQATPFHLIHPILFHHRIQA